MHCIYRRLTPADLEAALQMKRDFRPELMSEEGAAAFLSDGDRCWLFAGLLEGRVIAFAYGYALPRLDGRRMLYIHEVGVQEAYQHQGYGTALLTALKDACRHEGFHRFFLIAHQNNAAANALYRRCGGEVSPDSGGSDTTWFFIL